MPRVFKAADYGDENFPFIKTKIKVEEDTDSDDDVIITSTQEALAESYSYQQKKNIAQAMIDVALMSANVNQLRYVLDMSTAHPYYYFSVISISISIFLQFLVGMGLVLNFRERKFYNPRRLNDLILTGTLLITITNMFIASFSTVIPAPRINPSIVNHE